MSVRSGRSRASAPAGLARAVLPAVLAAVVGVLALGWQTPASAHASLVSSTPEAGERLAALPDELSFTFSEEISAPAYAVLNSPDGDQIASEDVRVDGDTVRVAVVDDGGAGTYTAAFRVVSSDGHPVTGQVEFVVGDGGPESPGADEEGDADPATGTDAATGDASSEDASAGSDTSGGSDDGLLAAWQWAVGLGLFALAGVLWLLSRRVRR